MSTSSLNKEITATVGEHPYARRLTHDQRLALATLSDVISSHMSATPVGIVDAACGILHTSPEDLRDALRPVLGVLDAVCERKPPEPAFGPGPWPFAPDQPHACTLNELVSGSNGHLYAPCCGLDLT